MNALKFMLQPKELLGSAFDAYQRNQAPDYDYLDHEIAETGFS